MYNILKNRRMSNPCTKMYSRDTNSPVRLFWKEEEVGILAERTNTVSVARPMKPPLLVEALAVLPCSTSAGSDGPGELGALAWKEELSMPPANVPSVTEGSSLSSAPADVDELYTGSVTGLDILSAPELPREGWLLPIAGKGLKSRDLIYHLRADRTVQILRNQYH